MIKTKNSVAYVPPEFQPHHPFPYPIDNILIFEEWFYRNFNIEKDATERVYLPVFFTSYYVLHQFGQIPAPMISLQNFLNGLDRTKKYFTIVQYDDGILSDISHLDIKVFGMSAGRLDYPLPLLCTPHEHSFLNVNRSIFGSFLGRATHPIRKRLYDKLHNNNYYMSFNNHHLMDYCNILARSIFTLAPRGYGPSSFRIMEALQYGSIPVYISDVHVEPHNIPFDDYGVKISEADVDRTDEILKSFTEADIKQKQMACAEVYSKYYTYLANKKLIIDHLRNELA